MIGRGTTPQQVFTTSIDLTTAEVLYITYKQAGKIRIEKTIDDCTITSTSVSTILTQEETLQLIQDETVLLNGKSETPDVEIQIRARLANGEVVRSNIMVSDVGRILKGGEI